MPIAHPSLTSAAVFFNKEERSIKKGFDLTFHEVGSDAVWYGEVKSGGVQTESADAKSKSLLNTAASDLASKLGPGARRSRWDAALIDAGLTLQSPLAGAVKSLLRTDADDLVDGLGGLRDGLLSSAVFHEIEHCCVSPEGIIEVATEIVDSARFRQLRFIAIQENAYAEVVDFLRSEI
jgi:hypothetical protein